MRKICGWNINKRGSQVLQIRREKPYTKAREVKCYCLPKSWGGSPRSRRRTAIVHLWNDWTRERENKGWMAENTQPYPIYAFLEVTRDQACRIKGFITNEEGRQCRKRSIWNQREARDQQEKGQGPSLLLAEGLMVGGNIPLKGWNWYVDYLTCLIL